MNKRKSNYKMRPIGVIGIMLLLNFPLIAQQQSHLQPKSRKGDLYFYWGWNWDDYSPSDVHFKGTDYDFTLYKVVSNDQPKKFRFNSYLNPARATIPQFNIRIGYFLDDRYNLSIGMDHMKYVVTPNQVVSISGYIENTETIYDGTYNRNDITIEKGFLELEHTNGLNYFNVDLRRVDDLTVNKKINLSLTTGVEAGFLRPKTNTSLLDFPTYDKFHIAGYGIDVMAGIHLDFLNVFFVQSEYKLGFINMPDIRTIMADSDRASQKFIFSQINCVFGANIHLGKHPHTPSSS